jgi:Uma2 family endonuclease
MVSTKRRAKVEDLYHVPENGKAELVHGQIVRMSPTGAMPGHAGGEIYVSLRLYEKQGGGGYAFPDNVGFVVSLPGRDSFSPDAAWYVGNIEGMKFVQGAPGFAAEVRSEGDYGPQAEREMAAKRADYFAAGTSVVWDVDLQSIEVVRKYTAADPNTPILFRRGEIADAEPAVPGWRMPVDDLFV